MRATPTTEKAAGSYLDIKRELIDLAIEEANESFRRSNIGHVQLRLVHAYVLPAVAGCEWLHLGAQGGSDFPPDTIAALATAGHRLCLDGQGPARGAEPGPVRLRRFPPESIAGVAILKLNQREAAAAAGERLDADALLGLGAPEVCVTMGADGVITATAAGLVQVAGTGAGTYADPTP